MVMYFHLFLLLSSLSITYSLKLCPDCGSTPIPYPLSTSPSCGDTNYPIRCNASSSPPTLFFDTLNNTYPITSISPSTQRLIISPSPLLPNSCITADLSTQGVQLDPSAPFNITIRNTILYLNCTDLILSSPLNCTSSSLCHSYVNQSSGVEACLDAPVCCTFLTGKSTASHMILVREAGCRAYLSFVNLDEGLPVSRWPSPGLELQWVSPLEPLCGAQEDCDEGSTCGLSGKDNGVRRCLCNSGFHWDPVGAVCAKSELSKILDFLFSLNVGLF